MKGLGTDERRVINTLTACNAAQRQQIKVQFKTMYGKVCMCVCVCVRVLIDPMTTEVFTCLYTQITSDAVRTFGCSQNYVKITS